MKLPVILDRYRPQVDAELKSILTGRKSPLYDMLRYHLGWVDEQGNILRNNSGKALRPALCLFSCEAAGGDYRTALPAAAALELVHNFSLIHDDIQDDDRERRHRPTVWAVWGKPQAINAGTAMRILAGTALYRLEANGVSQDKIARLCRSLDEVSLNLIEGQYLDISFEKRFDISENDYLVMIEGKTAALLSGSMEIGAYLGTDEAATVARFALAGRNLGLAFQIKDDMLGIWGDSNETGKPSGADILRRKKSFPVVHALCNAAAGDLEELKAIYRMPEIDNESLNRVLAIFEKTGTRSSAQKLVEKYCTEAARAFAAVNASATTRNDMNELIEFMAGRNY